MLAANSFAYTITVPSRMQDNSASVIDAFVTTVKTAMVNMVYLREYKLLYLSNNRHHGNNAA